MYITVRRRWSRWRMCFTLPEELLLGKSLLMTNFLRFFQMSSLLFDFILQMSFVIWFFYLCRLCYLISFKCCPCFLIFSDVVLAIWFFSNVVVAFKFFPILVLLYDFFKCRCYLIFFTNVVFAMTIFFYLVNVRSGSQWPRRLCCLIWVRFLIIFKSENYITYFIQHTAYSAILDNVPCSYKLTIKKNKKITQCFTHVRHCTACDADPNRCCWKRHTC